MIQWRICEKKEVRPVFNVSSSNRYTEPGPTIHALEKRVYCNFSIVTLYKNVISSGKEGGIVCRRYAISSEEKE